uniref:Glycine-rich protein n=1 Tax=Ononis spinosa TaxID=58890 RepID=A0A411AFK0_ONOSP|nr:glycine-rich protein [Ononis spinosa]
MKTNHLIFLFFFTILLMSVMAIEPFEYEKQLGETEESKTNIGMNHLLGGGGTEINGNRKMKYVGGKRRNDKRDLEDLKLENKYKIIPDIEDDLIDIGEGIENGKKRYDDR